VNLSSDLLPKAWLLTAGLIYLALWLWAALGADWRGLQRSSYRQHLLFGGALAVLCLWYLRAGVSPGLGIHLLGMTALTLMLGWRLALVASVVPLIGMVVLGREPWSAAAVSALLLAAVPVGVTHLVWRVTERWMPSNLFAYLFVCAFFGGVLSAALARLLVVGLLVVSGSYDGEQLQREYLLLLPLTLLPEGMLNGMLVSVMAVYRPDWLATFDAKRYLRH